MRNFMASEWVRTPTVWGEVVPTCQRMASLAARSRSATGLLVGRGRAAPLCAEGCLEERFEAAVDGCR